NGYEATTMKDIAARVNLTAASLYHHFRNKDFLLLAVLEKGLEQAIQQIEPIMQQDIASAEKLKEMIHTHVGGVTDNPAYGTAMVFEIKALLNASSAERGNDQDEYIERRDAFFAQRDYFEALFRQVIKEGIASSEFREVDAGIVTKAILGANNWVGVWFKPGGRLAGKQIADIMADTFLTSFQFTTEPAIKS
ncbi:MAG: TetR family transcriptional regulator, partial [Anaerolineae bacterium]|nr:TetR family transcriptional regulator [Anaerolineae bacterium]